MEAAEAASASLGPRYAPEDPTLPKPWKGLMDGSTGVLYYWNPETNVTQYEKPSALPPPGQPKLAPIPPPHSYPQNTVLSQAQSQSQSQSHPQPQPQPQSQQGQQLSQHGYQMQHQQSPQLVQPAMQPHQHAFQPMSQQRSGQQGPPHQIPGQQGPPHQMPGQQGSLHQMQGQQGPPHQMPGQQGPPHQMPGQQGQPQMMPGHQGFQNQGTQMAQGQQQLMHHQMNCGSYQPSMFPQGQQAPQQYAQQPYANQQDFKPIFPNKEEDGYQNKNRNQMRFHQAGQSQNFPTGAAPVHPGQPQQLSGSSNKIHQMQPNGDLAQNPISRFQPERDMSAMHNQQPNMPPSGLRPGLENSFGRVGNDFTYNSNQEVPVGSPQQPKLSAVPTIRSHQGTRFSAPYPNTTPGHVSALNNGAGYAMPNVHGHAPGGPPLSNSAGARPAYIGTPEPSSISSIESYRQQHEVTASGDNVPAPFVTFESTGFPPEILREMFSAGFSSPTPIQAQTWPIALQSRDIVAIAKTGSGKTLGYLIPAFLHLQQRRNNSQKGPTVLVLAPTRELATQIQDEVVKFGRSSRVSCTCLYGGAPKGAQLKELERGADIVVATPGRLNDILEMKRIDFWQVSLLILDEADRMLDMGFEPQIRKIVNEIPPRRQTLMFTATWPKEVRKIAGDLLVSPVQVNIGNVDELSANKAITQYVEVVPPMEKQRRLEQILRSQERGSKIIIFCSTKRLCDQLTRNIGRNFGAAAIHGDKSQGERDWVLNQFRSGKTPVLVATDVAARGLDIKDIRVVINYDFPTGIEDYVHRIGRTGRAGATGLSYTFFSEQDWKYATDLIKLLEGANQRVPQDIREIAMRGGPGFGKDRRFDRGGGRGFGGRGDFFDGGNRGRGFSGPDLGRGGFGRNDRVIHGGYNMDHGRGQMDHGRGFGRGGRGRFDSNRRDSGGGGGRGRDRSYSRSPERVRTWGYNSKRQSRSRSWSRSRSRSRSRSYSRSPRRRSRSRSYERRGAPATKQIPELKDTIVAETPDIEAPGLIPTLAPPETELVGPAPAVENVKSEIPEAEQDPVAGGEH